MDPTTAPLLNYGVIGICVIVLAIQYALERKRSNDLQEKRIDDLKLAHEQERKDRTEMESRYRQALDRVGQSLDSNVKLIESMSSRRRP